ncbi:insect cuticle protein domain-containing protein [Phthorimaea operculella]|nr:insect cuticle protein domain-containing protein [Phthorimaea operculella]
MKSFIVFALIVAAAVAAPAGPDADAQVLRYESDNIGVDGYKFAVETSNGISQQEQGQLVNAGSENEAIAVRGQYSYTGPDGVVYSVTYVADENGFQPQGAHLPVAPQ